MREELQRKDLEAKGLHSRLNKIATSQMKAETEVQCVNIV